MGNWVRRKKAECTLISLLKQILTDEIKLFVILVNTLFSATNLLLVKQQYEYNKIVSQFEKVKIWLKYL